jgi:DNA polymerase-3 subunit beta
MDITVSKKELLKVAARMAGIAERKSTMPMLASVLLVARDQELELAATDLYLALRGTIPVAESRQSGSVAIGAKDFVDRIKMLPDGPVRLTADERSLTIKGGGARKFTMRGFGGGDFPPIPAPDEHAQVIMIDATALVALIETTSFAVSPDETRPHINSALIEWKGQSLRMVATDGHRLAYAARQVAGTAESSILIPLKALREVRQLAEDVAASAGEQVIKLVTSWRHAFLTANAAQSMTFGLKIVEAVFPPYEQVIPTANTHRARAPRVQLLDAVRAVAIAAPDRTGALRFEFSNGRLLITGADADSGDGEDEVSVDYVGPNIALGFNSRYIAEALGALDADDVELAFNGELDPIVLRPLGECATDAIHVVMPMRV